MVLTILKNMSSSMGRIIPYIVENKKHVWNHQPVKFRSLLWILWEISRLAQQQVDPSSTTQISWAFRPQRPCCWSSKYRLPTMVGIESGWWLSHVEPYPFWKMMDRSQLGWWHPQLIRKNNPIVSKHQPVMIISISQQSKSIKNPKLFVTWQNHTVISLCLFTSHHPW